MARAPVCKDGAGHIGRYLTVLPLPGFPTLSDSEAFTPSLFLGNARGGECGAAAKEETKLGAKQNDRQGGKCGQDRDRSDSMAAPYPR